MLPPPQPNGFPVPILGLKMHESPGTRGVARHCDVIPLSRHATSEREITSGRSEAFACSGGAP